MEDSVLPLHRAQVQSLTEELRSSKPTHMVKEKKKGMTKARHSGLNKVQLKKVKPKLGRG